MTYIKVKVHVNDKPRRFVISQIEDYLFEKSSEPLVLRNVQSVFVTVEHLMRWTDKFLQNMDVDDVSFEMEDENSGDAMTFLFEEFYMAGGSDPFYFLQYEEPDFTADEHQTFFSRVVEGWMLCKTQSFYQYGIPIEELDAVLDLILEWYDLDGEYFFWVEDQGFAQHAGDIDVNICRYKED